MFVDGCMCVIRTEQCVWTEVCIVCGWTCVCGLNRCVWSV